VKISKNELIKVRVSDSDKKHYEEYAKSMGYPSLSAFVVASMEKNVLEYNIQRIEGNE
jgi:hypothetical protein